MNKEYTLKAQEALKIARRTARILKLNYVGTEHLLYGLSKEGSGVASKVLENQDVNPDNIL